MTLKPGELGTCHICGVTRRMRELAPYYVADELRHACDDERCREAARSEMVFAERALCTAKPRRAYATVRQALHALRQPANRIHIYRCPNCSCLHVRARKRSATHA